jgi:hypothetical protein
MNHSDLMAWYDVPITYNEDGVQIIGDIDVTQKAAQEQLCFLSAYSFALLHYGHGFEINRNFTVIETMSYGGATLKVGWQLGAIL